MIEVQARLDQITARPRAPRSTELMVSRRNALVASINDGGNLVGVALLPHSKTCIVKELMENRFGLESDDDFLKACKKADFVS